jgi:hypothetical protein
VDCENCGKRISEVHYNWFVRATIDVEQRRLAET